MVACDDVDLEIEAGEPLVLLGPSGCGKTTTLRCIAGLERPDNEDAIWVKGRNLTRVAPKDRNLAFVFQDTAMFPNLSVRRNISFGLDMRKSLPRSEIDRRVEDAARMLRIDSLLERYPRELSGGQGSGRRSVARSSWSRTRSCWTSRSPRSDAALRVEMRTEIKLIQRKLATTMIFVTHDQEEALTVGDKIAVMKDGVVQQVDTPHNIYHRPANLFVGTFIGSPPINRFECALQRRDGELRLVSPIFDVRVPPQIAGRLNGAARDLTLGIRPEFVQHRCGRRSRRARRPDRADGQPHAGPAGVRRPGGAHADPGRSRRSGRATGSASPSSSSAPSISRRPAPTCSEPRG